MNRFELSKLTQVEWVYLFSHVVCLILGKGFFGFSIILLLLLHASYSLIKANYTPLFLLLILGSYHSQFNNIYTTEILGINFIYILVMTYILFTIPRSKLSKNNFTLLIPFFIFFIINGIFGFFYKYSFGWYINELVSFIFFGSFIFTSCSYSKENVNRILNTIVHYVLYFYPILTFISIVTAGEENLYFDEFEKFYFLSLVPILFLRIPYKGLIIILHVVVFILKAQYTYTSSLNIILVICSISLLFLFSKLSFLRKLGFVAVILTGGLLVYQFSSKLTKFKVYQAGEAISEVLNGNVNAVPKSPRVRVIEFMISFENLSEAGPVFPFIGKGYGSYLDDNKTNLFEKYNIRLKPEDYSDEEIIQKKFKKGHGGIPYLPIKMGILGMLLFLTMAVKAFTLINKTSYTWLGISAPFYIITTFSYGMKNFIFVGVLIGVVLAIKYGNKINKKRNTANRLTNT